MSNSNIGTGTEQTPEKRMYYCSFCDKDQDQVLHLIAGPRNVYICNECIELCNKILSERKDIKAFQRE